MPDLNISQDNFIAKNKNIGALIASGILLGVVSIFSPGAIFSMLLIVAIVFSIYRFSDLEERRFLVKLFIWGLVLRVIILLLIQFLLIHNNRWFIDDAFRWKATYLFGDDGYYTLRGWGMVQHIHGAKISDATIASAYENYGYSFYLYMIAFFYYLCGFSPISVTFINCILGVLTGVVYYFIAKEITDSKSARIAALLIVFFPSLMVWSIANLKDPSAIFLIGITLLAFVRLMKTGKIRYLVLLSAALFMQVLIRPKFILIEFGIALWALIFYMQSKKKSKFIYLFLIGILIVIMWPALSHYLAAGKAILISYNRGSSSGNGFYYRIYDDWVYEPNANYSLVTNFALFKALLIGWTHFILEPFPWKARSALSVAAFPQMIMWYLILPFAVNGIFNQLKLNKKITLALLVFLLFMGTIFAMTSGNIGTNFRMRDMLTPLILLFAAVGLRHFFWGGDGKEHS